MQKILFRSTTKDNIMTKSDTLSINALAAHLGRDRRTVSAALRGVKPDGHKGRFPAWSLATAVQALAERSGAKEALAEHRCRLIKEQADNLALRNEKIRQENVPAAEAAAVWKEWNDEVRAKFLVELPERLKPKLPHWTPYDWKVLDEELRAALEPLDQDAALRGHS
jgi:phage terminase Nu1 subunit (DNA packaging protein)